jgi:hypothetical protein
MNELLEKIEKMVEDKILLKEEERIVEITILRVLIDFFDIPSEYQKYFEASEYKKDLENFILEEYESKEIFNIYEELNVLEQKKFISYYHFILDFVNSLEEPLSVDELYLDIVHHFKLDS